MTASNSWGKTIVHTALILCLISFLLTVYAGYEYYSNNTDDKVLEKTKEDAYNKANVALENISGELNSTSLLADGIAKELHPGKLNNDSILRKHIWDKMEDNPNIFSIVIAYSPAYYGKLHSLHLKKNGSNILDSPILYDYTNNSEETTTWYNNAMKQGCGVWNRPYFGIADGTYLIDYSTPFYLAEFKNGSEVAGVVCVSHSIEGIRTQIGGLDLGNTGYGFIFSNEGLIISYPVQDYLLRNIHKLAKEDTELNLIGENISKNMTARVVKNDRTGQSSWVFYKNIRSTDWVLGTALPQEEILLNQDVKQDRSIIQVMLLTFSFLFFLSLLFVSVYRYDDRNLWLLALIFSSLCVLGMNIIWHFTLNESSIEVENGNIVVFDIADVETVLLNSNTNPKAFRVPMGVFIQSIEFSTSNDIIMTGYVWQNISGLSVEKASPRFSFPESKESTVEKAYVDEDKNIIGWRFTTILRQQFDYSRYPFDEENIWIKFWNNASEESVLVPDFDSYDSLAPEKLLGLENSLVLEGWKPQKNFFSYRANSYNTNFGVKNFRHRNVPELYFNIAIKRDLKSPFVSDLLPIIVVAILLFVVLLITTREEENNQFGFKSSGVLTYCASLFFVLIVSHASLRAKTPTNCMIYLEYFYLILYLAILAVSLNSIVFASHMNIPFIDTKDNLYVKVLYWPIITGFLLIITLLNFC